MKVLCACGCRRPGVTRFRHATLGLFTFGALCTIRNRTALEAQGWIEYPNLDEPINQAFATELVAPTDCA